MISRFQSEQSFIRYFPSIFPIVTWTHKILYKIKVVLESLRVDYIVLHTVVQTIERRARPCQG